jgi:tetratricopeptide (TPR) repeat protein
MTAMRLRFLPFLILALPLITWAADDCNGAPPYDCAVALVQRGRLPAAIDLLEKLTAESPQNLKALNLLGIALSASGNLDKANARFEQALQADPAFLPALENLSINHFALGHADQAKAGLEAILKNSPNDESAHVYLGEIAFGAEQFGEAAAHYGKAGAKVYPVILHYAECLLKTGRKDSLAAVLGAIPAEDTEKQFQAGVLLGNDGAYLEAAPYFGRARVHASDPYTTAYDQTLMLIRGGDYAGAIQLSDELFGAGLRRGELYNLVSEAYVKSGQVEKAYHALRTATELEPEAEDNYIDFAGICLDNSNYQLGLEIVDAGLKHLPDSYRLHMHRGLLMAHQGLTEEAQRDFEIASRLSPSQSLPYVALGLAWMESGDTPKAVEMLRARVKANANDFMLPYLLGVALSHSDAEPGGEAKSAFETSVQLNPRFSPARAQLGKLLLKSGNLGDAVEQLETAIKLDPEDATAAYQLGQAYRRMGDGARAQEMLARVVKLRHQKDDIDPQDEMQRLIRQSAASGEHPVAK